MRKLIDRLIDWPLVGVNKVCINQNEALSTLLCQSQKYFMDFTAFLGVIAGYEKPGNPILGKPSLRAYPEFGGSIFKNGLHI